MSIQSKLDYVVIVYRNLGHSQLYSLNTVQHSALRLTCDAFCTISAIRVLADLGKNAFVTPSPSSHSFLLYTYSS